MGFGTSAVEKVSVSDSVNDEREDPKLLTVSTGHASLHYNDLFTLPRMQDRHTSDGGAWLERDRVHGVVGTNDERNVGIPEIVVDLIHLQHNCKLNASAVAIPVEDHGETYCRTARRLPLRVRYTVQAYAQRRGG